MTYILGKMRVANEGDLWRLVKEVPDQDAVARWLETSSQIDYYDEFWIVDHRAKAITKRTLEYV